MMRSTNFRLLKAIRERGWLQLDLVGAAKLSSEARLSRIIHNRTVPTKDEVERVCRALEKTPEDLGLNATTNIIAKD